MVTGLPGAPPVRSAPPIAPAADTQPPQPAADGPFRFNLQPGEVLIVEKYQDIRVDYPHGRRADREEKNKIVLRVTGREGTAAVLEGTFTTYTRMPARTGVFRFDRRFFSRFRIHDDGRYEVPEKYMMPNLRDLPRFPAKRPAPGALWKRPASETIRVGRTRFLLPVRVAYRYRGVVPITPEAGKAAKEGPLPNIQYVYTINQRVARPGSPIRHVTGFSSARLWWLESAGIPRFDSNRLAYTFTMFDGSKVNYRFRILSWYRKQKAIEAPEKTRITDEVRKDLEKKPEVAVDKQKEGIRLTLNAVLFDFDSANLTADAKRSLEAVAQVLRKHPDREIRVSGHTDNRGRPAYNRRLSERRARAVVEELRRLEIDPKRLSFRGYGESRPVASNATNEGRAKNRRVEILIVTE